MDSGGRQGRQISRWEEDDAYTAWRQWYCYLKRAKAVRRIKRRTHRRERKMAQREVIERLREYRDGE